MDKTKLHIKTSSPVIPMIYAYTTPQIKDHYGWTKIGYTEQNVDKRIRQQTHTADIEYKEEWRGTAIFDDGSGECFKDTDFHRYLIKNGVKNDKSKNNEWFHISGKASKQMFYEFKSNRGLSQHISEIIPYKLRAEQVKAEESAMDFFKIHENGEFLWNAKPRFGKTLTVYDLCKKMNFQKVLIVTNRPAIANSWREDYCKFLGTESGFYFISSVDSIKDKMGVISREDYLKICCQSDNNKFIEFVSLQDLKGSKFFGGNFNKLREIADIDWDILVIDEAHEGVDTYKTDVAFDHIHRKYTLHLSGTPFKALANDKFKPNAIYNWTYADEQRSKRDWTGDLDENPYKNLPKLNMFTYQMSEIIKDELSQGVEINGETAEYAFDLNEFFATSDKGRFLHNDSVNKFLDAMTTLEKYPFSTEELRNELKHTLWILNRVDSAKALARKLEKHPVFKDYHVILAAGDGKLDSDTENSKAFDKVTASIAKYDKTITLSVGQLTTGVTIPEWTAVLMLSSLKSPSLYMQTAFRAQNPCLFANGVQYYRKKNAYVFDFDPARTLIIFEEFANDLSSNTSSGKGDSETRKENVRELLNFFPVIGEDDEGTMIELDAEKVLSIPRKIKSTEVVKRGFMSDFLFQNVSNVFHAPQEVIDIIRAIDPAKDPGDLTVNTGSDLSINKEGEIELPDELIIGTAKEVFGEKLFDDASSSVSSLLPLITPSTASSDEDRYLDELKEMFHTKVVDTVIDTASTAYGPSFTSSSKSTLNRRLNADADQMLNKAFRDLKIQQATLESDFQNKLLDANDEEIDEIKKEYKTLKEETVAAFKEDLSKSVDTMIKDATKEVVKKIETDKREEKKRTIEDGIKDHLRGFSRTIPSFLMAYGSDHKITLETFDKIIPDKVFKEVTSITLDQFRFLRDGGAYKDVKTGKEEFFNGHLFDPIVFNDSVKEFMELKIKLANYFDENNKEDIFDYIPPQKTNQIFTPKWVVKEMVDRLEIENPGCFDDMDKTFIDLYMKSGLYITELVKRLYNNATHKNSYPDPTERLQYIFEYQIYGLAPTEIIYRIATNYILGFDSIGREIKKHNLKEFDALPYAKDNTLEEALNKLF